LGVVKMLTDGGFVKFSGTGVLTRAGKALMDVWSGRIGNRLPKSIIERPKSIKLSN